MESKLIYFFWDIVYSTERCTVKINNCPTNGKDVRCEESIRKDCGVAVKCKNDETCLLWLVSQKKKL